jgi:hypothetical protein
VLRRYSPLVCKYLWWILHIVQPFLRQGLSECILCRAIGVQSEPGNKSVKGGGAPRATPKFWEDFYWMQSTCVYGAPQDHGGVAHSHHCKHDLVHHISSLLISDPCHPGPLSVASWSKVSCFCSLSALVLVHGGLRVCFFPAGACASRPCPSWDHTRLTRCLLLLTKQWGVPDLAPWQSGQADTQCLPLLLLHRVSHRLHPQGLGLSITHVPFF